MDCAQSYLAEFSRKYASTVQHMAREFDRRKTAKLHERARTARTGRINMTKLASYKFREDIFQQVTVLPNGKSHGIVLLVDGSGSMSKVFADVIDQVMLFTQFAEKVNIPVQAFVFQSHRSYSHPNLDAMPEYVAKPNGCELVCIYDSTATDRKSQQLALAAVAAAFNSYVPAGAVYGYCPINHVGISLGMTPLESGLLLVERHVANLKSRLRLEKLSLFVLTDGDDTGGITYAQSPSSASSYYRPNVAIYRDTVTRTTYADFDMREVYGRTMYYERQTGIGAMLVDSIRRRHDARVVRIHLVAKREMKGLSDPLSASYMLKSSLRPKVNDEGYTVSELGKSLDGFKTAYQTGTVTYSSPACYYDALVVVSTDKLDLDEDDFDSKNMTGWTARKITSAFVKSNVNATKNRVFVNTVVPYLA
jgi:Mg-chelatase subunit ChlD